MYVEVSKDYPLTYQINYYLMKTCTKCNEVKDFNEFCKAKKHPDGLNYHCKSCTKIARKAYYIKNKSIENQKSKEWRVNNHASVAKYTKDYRFKRYHSDPAFKLLVGLRNRLNHALNGNSKSASTMELLGCTAEHARFHIESQMTEGMTWENIHIDHIQPCASFDLEDPNEQRKCFHYTNIQPLLAEDNLRKSDSIVPEHQVRLL